MAINIQRYLSQQSLPSGRSALPDPGTASSLYRQGAQGAQYMAQSLLHIAQNETMFQHQQDTLDLQIRNKRRDAAVAFGADEARLAFDTDMRTWMRDAQERFKDDPEGFFDAAKKQVKDAADFHSSTRLADGLTNAPRFANDPEAMAAVRGDLYTRAQSFLEKADAVTTSLTVNKGLTQLAKAEDDRLKFAREATSTADVVYAIRDMAQSYGNAAGTIIDGKDAVKLTREFGDKAWMEYYGTQAAQNPEAFLNKVTVGKPGYTDAYGKFVPTIKTDAGMKDFQETAYRTFIANPTATSETTLTSALRMGNLTVEQYKNILSAKGISPDAVKDRVYAHRLAEVERGDVPIHALPDHVTKWATEDGLDKARIDSLKSATFAFLDRVTKQAKDAQDMGEKIAKEQGELLESRILDSIASGKIKSIDTIRPMLYNAQESRAVSAERKSKIEETAQNMIDAGGRGDGHKRNLWELDLRMNTNAHTPEQIRNDKTLNLVEMNALIKVLDEEKKKDRLSPQDKEVFDRERKNVSILYGEKGPMAQYTVDEAQLRVAAFQRFDDLVFKQKMHPRDAALKLREELNPNLMGRLLSGAVPPPQVVMQYAQQRAAGQLPPHIDSATLDMWIEQYKTQERIDRIFPKVDPLASQKEKK